MEHIQNYNYELCYQVLKFALETKPHLQTQDSIQTYTIYNDFCVTDIVASSVFKGGHVL